MGLRLPVFVSSGGQQSNQTLNFFNYDAPLIYSLTPVTYATDGNVVLTISGYSLGSAGTVTVGSSLCTQAGTGTSWVDSTILCLLPPGQGNNLVVQVTAGSQLSNTTLFSYNPPSISAVVPANGATTGGYVITLFGSSFGLSAVTTFVSTQTGAINVCSPVGIGQTHSVRRTPQQLVALSLRACQTLC